MVQNGMNGEEITLKPLKENMTRILDYASMPGLKEV
jgi:hypothetical protein